MTLTNVTVRSSCCHFSLWQHKQHINFIPPSTPTPSTPSVLMCEFLACVNPLTWRPFEKLCQLKHQCLFLRSYKFFWLNTTNFVSITLLFLFFTCMILEQVQLNKQFRLLYITDQSSIVFNTSCVLHKFHK